MTREEEIEHFFTLIRTKMSRGAKDYGNRSFARDPINLMDEILEELADVCGWAAVLAVRIRQLQQQLGDAKDNEEDL